MRLRTPEDDLHEDVTPTDPADPGPVSAPEPHEPQQDAVCTGDPVDLRKLSEVAEDEFSADDYVERVFLPNDRITGSLRHREGDPVPFERETRRSFVSPEVSERFSALAGHGDTLERGSSGCT